MLLLDVLHEFDEALDWLIPDDDPLLEPQLASPWPVSPWPVEPAVEP